MKMKRASAFKNKKYERRALEMREEENAKVRTTLSISPAKLAGNNYLRIVSQNTKWYTRLWLIVSFPFRYVINGNARL